jgi:dolichyl-phosphate beta-glucosyltransferase
MATDLAALDVAISLLAAGHPAVIGSRALAASVTEDRHSQARRAGAAVFRALAGQIVPGITDTQCGFKFFSGPLARAAALTLSTAGFAFDIELIAGCQRLGASLTEIPVRWRDMPGSTFSVTRHSAAAFRDAALIWARLRRAAGLPELTPWPAWPSGGRPSPALPAAPLPAVPAALSAPRPALAPAAGPGGLEPGQPAGTAGAAPAGPAPSAGRARRGVRIA